MKRAIFKGMIVGFIVGNIIGIFAGCSEMQLRRMDEIVQDVNNIGTGAQAILESPAGQMIPPQIRMFLELGIALSGAGVLTWQEWRNREMKKTTKSIVRGIENVSNPDKPTAEIKHSIAEEMMRQGGQKFYDRANKTVDRLKVT